MTSAMTRAMTDYNVLAAGDTALVVDFGNKVDLDISAKVLALAGRLNEMKIGGVIETVPTIRSLSIYYEPLSISAVQLERQIGDILENLDEVHALGRTCEIPVCYDREFAPDLDHVAAECCLTPLEVIEIHSGQTYHAYMLGFLPGLAYLGDLSPMLHLARRTTPRPRVLAGSLGIGGKLTCIYPMATPCGWHVIGRSPKPLWDPSLKTGAVLRAGDKVKFEPVSLREYKRMCPDDAVTAPATASSH
jgi:inhibitor of KinA